MTAPEPGTAGALSKRAAPEDWDPTNPMDTEQRLRELLIGRRLVGELDLSPGGSVFQMAKWVFVGATKSGDYSRLRHYPAVTAVFLVGEGGRCYDEGTFWPNIESLEGTTPKDRANVGEAFEAAVRELGIEDFTEIPEAGRWLRYVTPILLHGGIPASCANDAASLVLSNMRNGVQDAAELLDSVLRSTVRRSHVAQPLQRFFVYGGGFALDLVQRMIAAVLDADAVGAGTARASVVEMAEDAGLPSYLMQALLDGGSLGTTARGRGSPRPQVRIDRYSCNGPYLVLPPADGGGEWLLTGNPASRFKAMRRDAREVSLAPSRGWGVALRSTAADFRARFEGHPDVAAYVFDAAGRLTREQRRLKGTQALILAAIDVEILCDDGTPVPLAEELPARFEPWHGWRLLSVDVSESTAVKFRTRSAGGAAEARLPVSSPPVGPEITSYPVVGVTGPLGCPVYSEAPLVAVPDGTPDSAWRVRWRRDDEISPPPTALLKSLPRCPQGRDMSPSLPDHGAFWGTVEIVGPLGSDLRQHLAVVRGLRVGLPDRIVGPDEAVEATLSADCVLTHSDGSSGRIVEVVFAPGCDSVQVSADGVPLTVTIPRLSWAVTRRGGSQPMLSGEPQRIGLDEIESGEAESLLVRCGRPASVILELHGRAPLQQADPSPAAGEQGRWAFALSQFRDTAVASGLATMSLTLRADDTSAQAAVIEALHQVTDFQVEVLPGTEACEVLLNARWTENRRFHGRQLRLWSQHRLWEAPVCAEVPDDADGSFDCVLDAPPGPYLAQVALRDDWATPRRPSLGNADTAAVTVGSATHEQARLAALRPAVGVEALELAVSRHRRALPVDSRSVTAARTELQRSIAASCCPTAPAATLDMLIQFALAVDGLLPEMLVEELVWSLPRNSLLRLELAIAPVASGCRVDPEILEVLWEVAPVAAAVLDGVCDDDGAARWERFAGWVPAPGCDGPKQPSQPVSKPLDEMEPHRLEALADALPPMDSLPLQFGGYAIAAIEMLQRSWPDRAELNDWMAAHARVTTYTQRLSQPQRQQIDDLSPAPQNPGWHRFPARLLTAAFQITDDFASRADLDAATHALLKAAEIAPLLTTRSLLTAAAPRAGTHD